MARTAGVTLALAGDTMLGRGVADRLAESGPGSLFAPAVREIAAEADAFVLNLECCVSDRGRRARVPGKPFFFRAPPAAAELLAALGVTAVSLANNHSLDYGTEALLDTRRLLGEAGIAVVGAGSDVDQAREPAVLTVNGVRLGVLGVTDHPPEFAAGRNRAGAAWADLEKGVPDWLTAAVGDLRRRADAALVTVHWGPNMTVRPVPHVRQAAPELLAAGATLVAGTSAHTFHGFTRRVLFDLGGFIDDYAVHPRLRNDLGLLFLVTLDGAEIRQTAAVPIAIDWCHTRLADHDEYAWVRTRLTAAGAELGTDITDEGDRLVARWG